MRFTQFLVLLAVFASVYAQGEAEVTLQSTVSGSQEQPRVIYIVPWQQPGAAKLDYELNNGIAEELFTPIDRDEFVRGLAYGEKLREEAAPSEPGKIGR